MKCRTCGKEITQIKNVGTIRGLLTKSEESTVGHDVYLYSCDRKCKRFFGFKASADAPAAVNLNGGAKI